MKNTYISCSSISERNLSVTLIKMASKSRDTICQNLFCWGHTLETKESSHWSFRGRDISITEMITRWMFPRGAIFSGRSTWVYFSEYDYSQEQISWPWFSSKQWKSWRQKLGGEMIWWIGNFNEFNISSTLKDKFGCRQLHTLAFLAEPLMESQQQTETVKDWFQNWWRDKI